MAEIVLILKKRVIFLLKFCIYRLTLAIDILSGAGLCETNLVRSDPHHKPVMFVELPKPSSEMILKHRNHEWKSGRCEEPWTWDDPERVDIEVRYNRL